MQSKMHKHLEHLSNVEIKKIQQHLLSWFALNKRDFPWRHTRDPYNILISEVMSQQTQILRVVPKYENWLRVFPTLTDLAQAQTREVLLHWSGLGYNRRALHLQNCAQTIVRDFGGQFPEDEKTLLSLPGIGKYTARAILSFAFDKQVAVVDTNIKKVILTQLVKTDTLTEKELEEIAQAILPKGRAYEWNQALMDYASLELKKEKIHIPKQSKFKESDRYFRGRILAFILEQRTITKDALFRYTSQYGAISPDRFDRILHGLRKEMFLRIEEDLVSVGEE